MFCHLYIGHGKKYFVLIDEPELSLSIDWQEHFLTDVIESGVCEFMFAVTHSPFIFNEMLRGYRNDLSIMALGQ